jgi:uncharacterized protein YjbI with pentapeptide repeats
MANLKQVSGQHAMLSGADLSSCRLMMAHLERASCLQANFANADLNWTNLNDADCTGANFEHANLSGTNLVKADCSRANFFDTKMMNTNLSGANLSYVSLARAHPALACLKEAKLSHTDFGINRLSTDGFLNSKSALASPAKVSDGI